MFTSGRVTFAIFFMSAFAIVLFLSYKKDAKNHKQFYKGATKKVVFWGILVVVVFITLRYITSII